MRPAIQHTRLFIDGAWCHASNGATFPVIDPSTEKELAHVPEATPADVDAACAAAHRTFHSAAWAATDGPARSRLLTKLADLLERDADAVAALEAADSGKPLLMARLADVNSSIRVLRHHASLADAVRCGEVLPSSALGEGGLAFTTSQAIGPIAGVLPFNFPLAGAVAKLAPAVAAGCTVVLKPSEQCPLSALHVAALTLEAGWPAGVLNVVTGAAATGAALVSHPLIRKVSFTGSNAVGKIIQKACADRLARVTLELGGKNAMVVCPDADVEEAARLACGSNFFNSGSICVANSRVFVPDALYERFLAAVKVKAEARRLGDPFAEGTEQGPLVDGELLGRVQGYVAKGLEEGARLITGGQRWGSVGFWFSPTVFADVTDEMTIAKEEIFGPVMSVLRYSGDVEEAIERANATPYGLAATVVTKDLALALKCAKRLQAGTVWVNRHGVFDPALPYGGLKQSGIGKEYGTEGLAAYTEQRTIMLGC